MTRKEQNDYIIKNLADQLGDRPDVAATIGAAYIKWFQDKAREGAVMFASQQQLPQPATGPTAQPEVPKTTPQSEENMPAA